jgi:hypothetical protein
MACNEACRFYISENREEGKRALRIAIVSRDISDLRGSAKVRLDPGNDELVGNDIQKFVSIRMQELSGIIGFSDEFGKAVKSALLKRDEGTFLWVGFAMSELFTKKTCSEVEDTIRSLPKGLPAIYSRMLVQIEPSHRRTSSLVLRWVRMSLQPLSLQALAAAVDTRSSTLVSKEQAIRDQVTMFGHLLKIQDPKVRIVHQSAEYYLLREGTNSDAVLEEFRIKPEEAHLRITQVCLDCITRSAVQHTASVSEDAVDAVSQRQDPLLQYAVLSWPEHARLSHMLVGQLIQHSRSVFKKKSMLRQN